MRACGLKAIQYRAMRGPEAFDAVAVQKQSAGKKPAVGLGQFGLLADPAPFTGDRDELVLDDGLGLFVIEQEIRGGREAAVQRTHTVFTLDQHRLSRLVARSPLRADVIGRGQREHPTVPERSMVAGMIVRVAAQDIEDDPSVELAQRFLRIGWADDLQIGLWIALSR